MILAFFVFVNAAVTFIFLKFGNKRLHVLEMFMYWVTSTMLVQNYSAVFFMNYKYTVIPNVLSLEASHFINRIVLYPALILLFLNYYIHLTTIGKKIVFITGFTLLLSGVEWLEDRLGVNIHVHWKLWWTIMYRMLIVLISIWFMKFFRKRLKKEIRNREFYNGLE